MVRDKFVKIEPEEYNSVDEQIIPSKAKYSSEKVKKVGIQKSCSRYHLWFYVWLFRFMCNVFVYDFFFDNWLTMLDLLHHFRLKGINAASTIPLNR